MHIYLQWRNMTYRTLPDTVPVPKLHKFRNHRLSYRNFSFITFLFVLFFLSILHFVVLSHIPLASHLLTQSPSACLPFLCSEFWLYPLHPSNIGYSLSAWMVGPWQLSLCPAVEYSTWNPYCVVVFKETES